MKFSYNWIKELVPKLPKPEKLADLLTVHSFEIEGMKRVGKDYMLDVNILPNRISDASGHIGMAREIAAILGVSFQAPKVFCKEPKKPPVKNFLFVNVKDKKLCRRYMGSMVIDVEIKESPEWVRERLEVCGLRSINNVVDATNYVMLLTGQPLHAFDFDKLAGNGEKKTVTVRTAKEGERITTLDDVELHLHQNMLVIADEDGSLAIAGIKGGKKAEITADTKRIVIEAATFDGPSIRCTSQAVGLRTDSSVRFSVGLSASLAESAMEHACVLMEKVAGGIILPGVIDIYLDKEKAVSITLQQEYINSLLGAALLEKETKAILTRLGCKVVGRGKGSFRVTPPLWRRDLAIEEDLIEEVGRIYGLERIKPQHPMGELVPTHENPEHFLEEETKDIIAGLGFWEVYNYSFIGQNDISLIREDASDYFELENSLRPEFAFLRRHLFSGLLKNVSDNIKHEPHVRFFEIGHVYCGGAPQGMPSNEHSHLGMMMADKENTHGSEIFFELKGAVSTYFERLGLEVYFQDIPSLGTTVFPRSAFHPYRAALVKVMESTLGVLGEVHPMVLAQAGIKANVALFEVDFLELARVADEEKEFHPISKYPSMMRDIALLVPLDTRVVEVEDIIENTGGELLADTDLIDIYEGAKLPDGKKNFAFRLIFQAEDRTLTDTEVNAIMERITKILEQTNLEWEVRK